ncbi:MAG: carboxymuconolactone decarboxylase family protein [Halioglobus sp.]
MARVKLLEKDEVDPIAKKLFQELEDGGLKIANIFKVEAHSPKLCRDITKMGLTLLSECKLNPKLRELAILRVGDLTKSSYEWAQHVPYALKNGAHQEQIDALSGWPSSDRFDSQERAVLQYTDEMTQNIRVADPTFSALKDFLSEEEIVELTMTVGYYAMICRLLEALEVELES